MINPEIFIPIARAAEEAAHEVATEAASGGVAGTLGINLTYFVGQLITFSIILFILWKWVFTPVAKKLTERTEKIEKAMHDADRITKEKAEFEKWKNEQIINTRHEASVIINHAQTEANKVKDQTLVLTRNDQEKLIEQARSQMETEKNRMLSEAKSEVADLVTMAAEKILRHKMEGHKDQDMVKEILKNI